jgi:Rho GTPase-activating protein RGD1
MSGEFNRSETNGDGFRPTSAGANGSAPTSPVATTGMASAAPASAGPAGVMPKGVEDVMYSDIGVNTLLNRLKQSIASARDFAAFLKKRSSLEEEQATGLKRLARSQLESLKRMEVRSGSYQVQLAEVMRVHERMADNGMQFALSLHQMHEDLNELSANMERGRKQWKHEGLDSEKRASDAEAAMQKAKAKYDSLAEDYDRARTGDTKGSKRIGIKGPKSAEQYESDLLRKTQMADQEYEERVKQAKRQRESLINAERPKAVKALQELIKECDSALTLQLQKFATFNEKLLLGNGLAVTPLTEKDTAGSQRSMRDVIYEIDNDTDFHSYIRGHLNKIPARPSEIKYEQHPTLAPKTQKPFDPKPATSSFSHTPGQQQPPPLSVDTAGPGPASQAASANSRYGTAMGQQSAFSQSQTAFGQPPSSSFNQPPPGPQYNQSQSPTYGGPPQQRDSPYNPTAAPVRDGYSAGGYGAAPPYPTFGSERSASYNTPQQTTGSVPGPNRQFSNQLPSGASMSPTQPNLPPLRPVFGVSLEELFTRDQNAVPIVVMQCILAVDTFGLDVEGIYRLSGNVNHINSLKSQFDHNAGQIDFRNPANFFHDVNSVATLMKQFFRDLPDPLFTQVQYAGFIDAAKIEDDNQRRDALHQNINDLPDPNYATLRALVLHLHRVMQNESRNRMGASNLALCFA